MLYQVKAPHFAAGIVVEAGKIEDAAPILRWSIGKQFAEFKSYCNRKAWSITDVNEDK